MSKTTRVKVNNKVAKNLKKKMKAAKEKAKALKTGIRLNPIPPHKVHSTKKDYKRKKFKPHDIVED